MSKIYQKTLPAGNNAGFTLIELLVVVLSIGMLAAVAVPKYELAVEKARAAEPLSVLRSILDAQELYYMANGTYADNLEDLDIKIPESKNFNYSWYGYISISAWSKKKSYVLAYRNSQATDVNYRIVCGTDADVGTANYEFARKICASLGANLSKSDSTHPRWPIVE